MVLIAPSPRPTLLASACRPILPDSPVTSRTRRRWGSTKLGRGPRSLSPAILRIFATSDKARASHRSIILCNFLRDERWPPPSVKYWMDYPATVETARSLAIVAAFSALIVGSNLALADLPGVKLLDTLVFVAAFLFGFRVGGSVAVVSELAWSFISPWGVAGYITPLLVLGELIYALAGFAASRVWSGYVRPGSMDGFFIGAVLAVCAAIWDIDTRYALLAANYNGLLSNYSRSISLLSRSIAIVNTSQPVYREASRELSALWREYLVLKPASTQLQQDSVLVDFGNGTRSWYNNTQLQPGWNLYIETVVLMKGNVVAQWFPQYGSHLVSGIGGAGSTSTKYWFIWTYDKTQGWQQAQVGADQLQTQDGSVFAWTLCAVDQNFQPNCKP